MRGVFRGLPNAAPVVVETLSDTESFGRLDALVMGYLIMELFNSIPLHMGFPGRNLGCILN